MEPRIVLPALVWLLGASAGRAEAPCGHGLMDAPAATVEVVAASPGGVEEAGCAASCVCCFVAPEAPGPESRGVALAAILTGTASTFTVRTGQATQEGSHVSAGPGPRWRAGGPRAPPA